MFRPLWYTLYSNEVNCALNKINMFRKTTFMSIKFPFRSIYIRTTKAVGVDWLFGCTTLILVPWLEIATLVGMVCMTLWYCWWVWEWLCIIALWACGFVIIVAVVTVIGVLTVAESTRESWLVKLIGVFWRAREMCCLIFIDSLFVFSSSSVRSIRSLDLGFWTLIWVVFELRFGIFPLRITVCCGCCVSCMLPNF